MASNPYSIGRTNRTLSRAPIGVQEQLPLDDKPLEPWQRSRQQFEADPSTVWRAEGADRMGETHSRLPGGLFSQSSGIHFGTRGAAVDRGVAIATDAQSREERAAALGTPPNPYTTARPVRLFSARTIGKFSNQKTVGADPAGRYNGPMTDRGNRWPQFKTGRWYINNFEDKGSISGYAPKREGFLETHQESVLNAVQSGKAVHPNISWEAHNAPEYSDTLKARPVEGDEWKAIRQRHTDEEEGRTMFRSVWPGGHQLTHDEYAGLSRVLRPTDPNEVSNGS